jgi:hypothetical protein
VFSLCRVSVLPLIETGYSSVVSFDPKIVPPGVLCVCVCVYGCVTESVCEDPEISLRSVCVSSSSMCRCA